MNRVILLLATMFCAGVTVAGKTPVAPTDQPLATILWIKPICLEKGRYIGWPTVALTRKGTLIAAFSGDRDGHICPWGKAQVVRSTDGGETWSEPKTIYNSPLDDRDCGLTVLPDGEILLITFSGPTWRQIPGFDKEDYKPDSREFQWRKHAEKLPEEVVARHSGIWALRSRDDGITWSEPERLANIPSFTPHGPIVLSDGSLFQAGRTHYSDGRCRINTMRSTDGGHNWTELCHEVPTLPGENDKPNSLHEPHTVELADGRLLMLVRYEVRNYCLRQAVSSDKGLTWTPLASTGMLGHPAHVIRLQDGRLLCTFGRRCPRPTGFGEYACVSCDEGKTWDVEHEIYISAHDAGDLGYPSTVQLDNGDLLTVYYQPPASGEKYPCLMATKWRLK